MVALTSETPSSLCERRFWGTPWRCFAPGFCGILEGWPLLDRVIDAPAVRGGLAWRWKGAWVGLCPPGCVNRPGVCLFSRKSRSTLSSGALCALELGGNVDCLSMARPHCTIPFTEGDPPRDRTRPLRGGCRFVSFGSPQRRPVISVSLEGSGRSDPEACENGVRGAPACALVQRGQCGLWSSLACLGGSVVVGANLCGFVA